MEYVDQRTGLKFQNARALTEFQRDYPPPAFVQVGSQEWMTRTGTDDRPLTDPEKLEAIEAAKAKYTPEEIRYLSSTDCIGEYILSPIMFLAKWSR